MGIKIYISLVMLSCVKLSYILFHKSIYHYLKKQKKYIRFNNKSVTDVNYSKAYT